MTTINSTLRKILEDVGQGELITLLERQAPVDLKLEKIVQKLEDPNIVGEWIQSICDEKERLCNPASRKKLEEADVNSGCHVSIIDDCRAALNDLFVLTKKIPNNIINMRSEDFFDSSLGFVSRKLQKLQESFNGSAQGVAHELNEDLKVMGARALDSAKPHVEDIHQLYHKSVLVELKQVERFPPLKTLIIEYKDALKNMYPDRGNTSFSNGPEVSAVQLEL